MQQLPPVNKATLIANGIKYGLPILGVGIGIYAVRRMLKRNPDGTSSRVAPSIKETVIDRQNLTISASDAALYANTLYGAMLDFGTDEKVIYSTIDKIQSKDDMLLVIKAFGMKQYLWGTRAAFLGQDFNLIGWFRQELSESEISKIKPKFDSWGIPL
ncbi:hypothetical protein KDU71_13690 [Carboxylicivirga sediminis]|uniref:Uncharacterized protein n=1 Tax=Carboxylicivirga sediminis TaxID=2006564 RepID=A0A941IZF2_9BACT|nr:hypothetical protein [Carboxylicivirga sediminis]MBR8536622.1 hypothetical protein [Carboxylicivirga sediminis]